MMRLLNRSWHERVRGAFWSAEWWFKTTFIWWRNYRTVRMDFTLVEDGRRKARVIITDSARTFDAWSRVFALQSATNAGPVDLQPFYFDPGTLLLTSIDVKRRRLARSRFRVIVTLEYQMRGWNYRVAPSREGSEYGGSPFAVYDAKDMSPLQETG
jgi:hypothetical protein